MVEDRAARTRRARSLQVAAIEQAHDPAFFRSSSNDGFALGATRRERVEQGAAGGKLWVRECGSHSIHANAELVRSTFRTGLMTWLLQRFVRWCLTRFWRRGRGRVTERFGTALACGVLRSSRRFREADRLKTHLGVGSLVSARTTSPENQGVEFSSHDLRRKCCK